MPKVKIGLFSTAMFFKKVQNTANAVEVFKKNSEKLTPSKYEGKAEKSRYRILDTNIVMSVDPHGPENEVEIHTAQKSF